MSEVDCAQMMVKTRHLAAWQSRRSTIAAYWMNRLDKSPARSLIDKSNFDKHCFHKFVVDIDNRDQVRARLLTAGIDTRVHYKHPLHELPAYQHYPGPDILSAASSLSRRCLSLPIYPELTDLEVEYIIDQLLDVIL
jgi:dTDP-4-amino-4,6-dideoxygalactose transaminase